MNIFPFVRGVLIALCLALVSSPAARAETTFTLNFGSAIPGGMRLCDAEFSPNYCVDILLDPATSGAVNVYATYGANPLLQGDNLFGGTTGDVVVLRYTTENSPTPFNLDYMNISNILSLTAGDAANVRDAYAWSSEGTWTIFGTGGAGSPAGAVVSVDRGNTFGGTGTYVGDFVIPDPDVIGCAPPNNINEIWQFNALVWNEPVASSDVLLNMCGPIDGHNVAFYFDTPTTETKLYIFNANDGGMVWAFNPSTTVTLSDPQLTTIEAVVDNSAGGTATVSDFILSYDNGAGTSGSGITGSPEVTDLTLPPGDYDLTATSIPNYTTTLSCVGAVDTDLSDGLTLQDGDRATCTFTMTYVPPPPPAFPTGPGLTSSLCNVASPVGNAWADIGARWDNNSGTGGTIDRTDIFASVAPFTVSGLTAQINTNDINIDRNSIPATYSASSYIGYSFTTQAFTDIVEIYGLGIAGYEATQPAHNQDSGFYTFAVQIDEDPAFGSPTLLMADTRVEDGTMPGAVATWSQDFGTAIYNFGHYDASGSVVQLLPSTTYYLRVYTFNDTQSGMDDLQPYAEVVLWDDMMLKVTSCIVNPIDAIDDDFTPTAVNGTLGGTAGDAYANDTLSGAPVTQALVSASVVTPATPVTGGDPVPYLEVSGASEGLVIVPADTPEATYTIVYQLCEEASPANCDTATISVAVVTPPAEPADLSLEKVARSTVTALPITEAREGDAIDWELEVTNSGPGAASGIEVTDLLPSGFAYVSDDAADSGTSYDDATGAWSVGSLAAGETKVLRIRTLVLSGGDRTNIAEIVASNAIDPDSDPATGPGTDDLGDGLADDDEASWTVTLIPATRTLSGTIFIDNGTGGGTAHDATKNGGEVGTNDASITIYDEFGAVLSNAVLAADGTWIAEIDPAYSAPVTLVVTPIGDKLTISEATSGLPALVDTDPTDGSFTFTPLPDTDYANLDIGLVTRPTLVEDQEVVVIAGQSALLSHSYDATSDGLVTFGLTDENQVPADAFTVTLFKDDGCDGTPDATVSLSIPVVAGDRVCVIVRVVASAAADSSSTVSYQLEALTSFSGTAVTSLSENTDLVVVSSAVGQLVLAKTVRNTTQSTPEGQSNAGAAGDVLEYRIMLSNPSSYAVGGISVYDQTPAYTRLAAAVPDGLPVGGNLTCFVAAPVTNTAGYSGALRWDCIGFMSPGDSGSVLFQVEITP